MREYLKPLLHDASAVISAVEKSRCNRCLAEADRIEEDYHGFWVCKDCESNSTQLLYRYVRCFSEQDHVVNEQFQLTKYQQMASRFFVECIQNHQSGFLLAVCGAGKTEITLEGIFYALKRNGGVCFAIPRKQVVIQLAKRLAGYFPKTVIKPLFAEAKDDSDSPLLVSTIHQLVHFYHEFDVLILDEVDCYPFYENRFLHRLVTKALKPGGVLFMMSATMDRKMRRNIRQNQIRLFTSPTRFHGKDLDLPRFEKVDKWILKDNNLMMPIVLFRQLEQWKRLGKQAFLFVPTIDFGERVFRLLCDRLASVGWISSETVDKQGVLSRFKTRKIDWLVTTTILERGVTFPDVQVAVLKADHPVFTQSTLIQIAGRVGRYLEYSSGEVVYFSESITRAMKESRRLIKAMNRKKRRGQAHDL